MLGKVSAKENPVELFMLLYVGPDQVMPVMSILATIAGLVMVFWNKVLSVVRRVFGLRRSNDSQSADAAHAPGSEPPKQA